MRPNLLMIIISISMLYLFVGCGSSYDDDYIPYGLTGLNVYLFDEDKAPDGYFAELSSNVDGERESGLSRAQSLAYSKATELHFDTSGRYTAFLTGLLCLREVGRGNGLCPAIMFVNICGFGEIMQK